MAFWTAQNKLYAMQALIQRAQLSPMGAAGLVSRWANVESTANGPTAVNPRSGAFGIAQWLGTRKAGIYPNTNFDAQLSYAASELNGVESRAGNVLRGASSPAEAARGAAMYERAEGYNPSTGNDNWSTTTASGAPAVYALLHNANLPSGDTGNNPNADYQDSPITLPNATLGIGLLIGGALLLWLYSR